MPIRTQIIYDPQSTVGNIRTPFPGQVIPQNRFSAISRKLLSSIPDPTRSALLGNYDYVGTGNPNIVSDPIWSLKFDHAITTRHRVAFFLSKDNQLSDVLAAFDGPLGQGLKTYQRPDNWRINYDWIAKPNLLVHFTYGYSRTRQFWDNPQQKGAPRDSDSPISRATPTQCRASSSTAPTATHLGEYRTVK